MSEVRRPGVVMFDSSANGKGMDNNNENNTDFDFDGDDDRMPLRPVSHHRVHDIFSEMDVLDTLNEEWTEKARWIKYEQVVEDAANRWGKPHVSTLSFHSLLELRKCIEHGSVLLDVEDEVLPNILTRITTQMVEDHQLHELDEGIFKWALQLRHRYLRPGSTLTNIGRKKQGGSRPDKKERKKSTAFRPSRVSMADGKSPKISVVDGQRYRSVSISEAESGRVRKTSTGAMKKTSVPQKELTPEQQRARARKNWGVLRNNLHKVSGRKSKIDFTNLVSDIMELDQAEKFLKYIPPGAETGAVLVGEADFLDHPVSAFVRLSESREMGLQLAEVPLPVRFIFIYLVPEYYEKDPCEVGRVMGTMLSNPKFKHVAYEALTKKDLVEGLDVFMEDSLVLPTGQEYEEDTLQPIMQKLVRLGKEIKAVEAENRRASVALQMKITPEEDVEMDYNPLDRTRKLFGGLIREAKRRYPLYLSDIKDGLNTQCLGAIFFIYFAVLAPSITFGGLLSEKTEKWIGVSETFLMSSLCGLLFAFFSGQPLVIVGVTGPMLVFEESLYQICTSLKFEYLAFHFWVGIWIAIIATVVMAFEGSCLLRYVSRFTQDIFALLISLIFIFESLKKLYLVFKNNPLKEYYFPGSTLEPTTPPNITYEVTSADDGNSSLLMTTMATTKADEPFEYPNTALLSVILCLGTFWLANTFKAFKSSHYLGKIARRIIGDFSIPLAIIIMVALDLGIRETYTEKLFVPDGFQPTDAEKRGWVVNPMGNKENLPVWAIFLAIVPALLAFILLFMEAEITNLIVHKNLVKGSGYHLDMNLLGLFGIVGAILGLPFLCGATVRSVTHLNALCVFSKTYAPGEKPVLEYVIEQRVTAICVYFLLGVSIFLGPVLSHVPVSVLFGVFLYMGVASLNGIQFWDRIKLIFTPVKHHPDIGYVRRVKTYKMHLFTGIQFLILVLLWVVKSTKASLAFPFLLILCVPIRKFMLPLFYNNSELYMLDADEDNVHDDDH